jgi:hypothetical protein
MYEFMNLGIRDPNFCLEVKDNWKRFGVSQGHYVLLGLSEPHKYTLCVPIDGLHHRDLIALLIVGSLIDAQSVDPEPLALFHLVTPEHFTKP